MLPKAFSVTVADFMSSANIYILRFNDFLSNIFNLSRIDMKSAMIAENTQSGHLTIKVKKTDPP